MSARCWQCGVVVPTTRAERYRAILTGQLDPSAGPEIADTWRAVVELLERDGEVSRGALIERVAAYLGTSRRTVENVVDAARRAGLLERRRIPGDHRRVALRLWTQGAS